MSQVSVDSASLGRSRLPVEKNVVQIDIKHGETKGP